MAVETQNMKVYTQEYSYSNVGDNMYLTKDLSLSIASNLSGVNTIRDSNYFLTAAVVRDVFDNPDRVNSIIIGLVIVVFVLVAVTLIQSKK